MWATENNFLVRESDFVYADRLVAFIDNGMF